MEVKGHIWKNGSNLEKRVTNGKMGKNGSNLEKMRYIWKKHHTEKNRLHLEKWVALRKMGHIWKNGLITLG